ncbi:MAG: hypothetical protein EZS28_011596 [Streblomastix strix]|uniref:Uncharacterized protein n=1 Tax=Streblomastix strix TaxID=222440 RepID=A0A5J4WD32_9EUKA|nr:MAG: hypothetical protein EZS28_011596 [Streblomastix strix]
MAAITQNRTQKYIESQKEHQEPSSQPKQYNLNNSKSQETIQKKIWQRNNNLRSSQLLEIAQTDTQQCNYNLRSPQPLETAQKDTQQQYQKAFERRVNWAYKLAKKLKLNQKEKIIHAQMAGFPLKHEKEKNNKEVLLKCIRNGTLATMEEIKTSVIIYRHIFPDHDILSTIADSVDIETITKDSEQLKQMKKQCIIMDRFQETYGLLKASVRNVKIN